MRGVNDYRRILDGVKDKDKVKHQQPKSPETPPPTSSQVRQDQLQKCKKQFVVFQGGMQGNPQQRPYAIPTSVISGGKRSKNSSSANIKITEITKIPEIISNSGASSEGEYDNDDEDDEEEFVEDNRQHEGKNYFCKIIFRIVFNVF